MAQHPSTGALLRAHYPIRNLPFLMRISSAWLNTCVHFSTIVPFGSSHAASNERERCRIGDNKEETW